MSSFVIAQLIVRRTIGNRKGFLLFILLPIVVISGIVGVFGKSSEQNAQIAVWNADRGSLGETVVTSVRSQALYDIVPAGTVGASQEALKAAVMDGQADAAVYIPENFTEKLLAGERPAVEMYRKSEQLWNAALKITLTETTERLDRTAAIAAAAGKDGTEREQLLRDMLAQQAGGGVAAASHQLTKPSGNAYVLVIGLMLMFVMILANQSIHGVMEDRSNRTMARMYAAPVGAWEIALGNFIGCLLIGTLQLVLILTLTRYGIGFDFGTTFGKLLLIMECFLLAAVGIASAVAGLIRNSAQLGQVNNLVVIPTCMLGGCFWPVGMMPDFMQKLANFMPQRWAIVALEHSAAGSSLAQIGLQLGVLLLFAAVLLAFGAYTLQPARN